MVVQDLADETDVFMEFGHLSSSTRQKIEEFRRRRKEAEEYNETSPIKPPKARRTSKGSVQELTTNEKSLRHQVSHWKWTLFYCWILRSRNRRRWKISSSRKRRRTRFKIRWRGCVNWKAVCTAAALKKSNRTPEAGNRCDGSLSSLLILYIYQCLNYLNLPLNQNYFKTFIKLKTNKIKLARARHISFILHVLFTSLEF